MNYIGSKFSILNFIDDTVKKFCKLDKEDITFCDIFSGTGAVGKHFKKKGYNIISNDIEVYSYITAKHFIGNNGSLEFAGLRDRGIVDVFAYLNELEGQAGFIYNNYTYQRNIDLLYNYNELYNYFKDWRHGSNKLSISFLK